MATIEKDKKCVSSFDYDAKAGVISVKTIPIDELDDETLRVIYSSNPAWVCEVRPEWVKKHHPEVFH